MKSIFFISLLLSGIFIGIFSCSHKVNTIYDENFDFSKYETFCWQDQCELTFQGPEYIMDSLMVEKVSILITEELKEKGYQRNPDDHDFLVDVHITLEEKENVYHNYEDHLFEEGQWITNRDQRLGPEDEVFSYIQGTFIIDVIDFEKGKLVWRNAIVGAFEQTPNIDDRKLKRLVKVGLRDFPPEK